jgi:hypothetical protein
MNFFSNTSTRGKILALVAVMAFLLVSVGYIGYRFTTKGAEDTRFMYYDRLLPGDWLNNTATNATGIKANVFALMTAADETVRKNLNDEISEFVRRTTAIWNRAPAWNWKRLTGRTAQGFGRPWRSGAGNGGIPAPLSGRTKGKRLWTIS